jgi:hypothetical protein
VIGHRARVRVARVADAQWLPRLDPSGSGYRYFVSLRTGESRWKLPRFLPESRVSLKVLCAMCQARLAKCHCFECDTAFCLGCFASSHGDADEDARARRDTHSYCEVAVGLPGVGSPVCLQCESRLGTYACTQCACAYCATCWQVVHAQDGFVHHEGAAAVAPTHRAADAPQPDPEELAQSLEAAAAAAAAVAAAAEAAADDLIAAKAARLADAAEEKEDEEETYETGSTVTGVGTNFVGKVDEEREEVEDSEAEDLPPSHSVAPPGGWFG